jgi:proteasome assembly chaperone (PAC2) family protein
MKPKPEEVQLVSINRYFDRYVVVDGEYIIDYTKNKVHNIQVDDTMQQLTLFGETMQTKTLRGNLQIPCKILQLAGEGHYKVTVKARLIFDRVA